MQIYILSFCCYMRINNIYILFSFEIEKQKLQKQYAIYDITYKFEMYTVCSLLVVLKRSKPQLFLHFNVIYLAIINPIIFSVIGI